MTIPDLQSVLYTCVISKLMGVRDEFGDNVPQLHGDMVGEFLLGYETRPRDFRHNYQRDKFLSQRDKYIVGYKARRSYHLLTEHNKNEIVLYENNLQTMFGEDTSKAVKLLTKMLHRMYDVVRVEEHSNLSVYDTSNNRHESRESF